MKLIPAHKVREMGLPALIETAIERVGDKPCFLTFDIDFIDPAYAPGTGTPEVGGFTSLEGLELVRALKDLNFVQLDFIKFGGHHIAVISNLFGSSYGTFRGHSLRFNHKKSPFLKNAYFKNNSTSSSRNWCCHLS